MSVPKDAKCVARISGTWGDQPCVNLAKVCRDDKFYCGIHDPVKVAERQKKRDEKFRAKMDEWDRRARENRAREARRDLCEAACEGVDDADLSPGLLADLLAACKLARDLIDPASPRDSVEGREVLIQAIAKAEGGAE